MRLSLSMYYSIAHENGSEITPNFYYIFISILILHFNLLGTVGKRRPMDKYMCCDIEMNITHSVSSQYFTKVSKLFSVASLLRLADLNWDLPCYMDNDI